MTVGFAGLGITIARERFVVRTDDHLAYGRLVAAGAGIGFMAHYHAAQTPGLQRLLPQIESFARAARRPAERRSRSAQSRQAPATAPPMRRRSAGEHGSSRRLLRGRSPRLLLASPSR